MRRTYIATLLNVCLAFLGVTSLASQSVLTKIEQPTEGYISTDEGLRLFYRFEGRGRERVVVVHGGPGMSMAALRPDLTPLAARRVVIYYDQRGGGRSTITDVASSINLEKHVDDLDAVRRFFDPATPADRSFVGSGTCSAVRSSLSGTRQPDATRRSHATT